MDVYLIIYFFINLTLITSKPINSIFTKAQISTEMSLFIVYEL